VIDRCRLVTWSGLVAEESASADELYCIFAQVANALCIACTACLDTKATILNTTNKKCNLAIYQYLTENATRVAYNVVVRWSRVNRCIRTTLIVKAWQVAVACSRHCRRRRGLLDLIGRGMKLDRPSRLHRNPTHPRHHRRLVTKYTQLFRRVYFRQHAMPIQNRQVLVKRTRN